MKVDYEAPRITVLGTVADLTGEHKTGLNLDSNFPAGTPLSDLTASN